MSKFHTSLRVEKISGDGWRVLSPLIYSSDVARRVFIVPEGFETDLASVPRLPLMFLLTGDTAHAAAVLHDFLYSSREVDRASADAVFREAAINSGEPAWRTWLMWAGVRLGGWSAWNAHATSQD